MCFTIRHEKRLGETLKLPRLSRVSEALTSRPAFWKQQRLVSVSVQKVSCTSLYYTNQLLGVSDQKVTTFITEDCECYACRLAYIRCQVHTYETYN